MQDIEKVVAHLRGLEAKHGMLRVEVSFPLALVLIGQLQLALRHPGNVGLPARQCREFLDEMIARLEANSPGFGAILRQGDDPARDVPSIDGGRTSPRPPGAEG
jgi:hypothetical protein